jgi:hypothetical protein
MGSAIPLVSVTTFTRASARSANCLLVDSQLNTVIFQVSIRRITWDGAMAEVFLLGQRPHQRSSTFSPRVSTAANATPERLA